MSTEWFFIRSVKSGNVIAASTNDPETALRSQVIVTVPTLSDTQLWCWKDQFLYNKATNLVLDIRKGKLRLVEDTEICLYSAKPLAEAHNQLWGVRQDATDIYGRSLPGSYIFSSSSNEWVLDIQFAHDGTQKLVLFPFQSIDNETQRWLFVPEGQLDLTVPISEILALTKRPSYSSTASSASSIIVTPPGSVAFTDYPSPGVELEYPQALTPAKRGSHSTIYSAEVFKDYHFRVYQSQDTNISDKGIAMAAAYHVFQNWKMDQISDDIMADLPSSSETRVRLQYLTKNEVMKILSNTQLYPANNKDNACALSGRLITQLLKQAYLICTQTCLPNLAKIRLSTCFYDLTKHKDKKRDVCNYRVFRAACMKCSRSLIGEQLVGHLDASSESVGSHIENEYSTLKVHIAHYIHYQLSLDFFIESCSSMKYACGDFSISHKDLLVLKVTRLIFILSQSL
ncbi:hypothetical protein BDF20DRAFT_835593 [Mycotypha africana]|uniref:uncharacterized protein n=1 Tax=Mycotypha africana TaxID=64632 RepID=UPI0022FFDF25|nr:uncharacterized protein BDF20DRAFT_835593 [Mycotypha africana]KAI8979589.1 hypothetical protein BDF20DRAFT_835593 [Mycotypha africana]